MIVDFFCIIVLVTAVVKGVKNGLILGLFSFLAIIIGLAAALKLSAVVAGMLGEHTQVSATWLPVLAFLLVFIGVIVLVRWAAGLLQQSVEWAMLGWVNRLGGIIFYLAIYLIIFSTFLFFVVHLKLVNGEQIASSRTYPYIQPWGPFVIDHIGAWIPLFRNVFDDLKEFFGNIA